MPPVARCPPNVAARRARADALRRLGTKRPLHRFLSRHESTSAFPASRRVQVHVHDVAVHPASHHRRRGLGRIPGVRLVADGAGIGSRFLCGGNALPHVAARQTTAGRIHVLVRLPLLQWHPAPRLGYRARPGARAGAAQRRGGDRRGRCCSPRSWLAGLRGARDPGWRHEPAHATGQSAGPRLGGRGRRSLVGSARHRHRPDPADAVVRRFAARQTAAVIRSHAWVAGPALGCGVHHPAGDHARLAFQARSAGGHRRLRARQGRQNHAAAAVHLRARRSRGRRQSSRC